MSVYVKGMEMPTSCAQCACCDDDARFCHAAHQYIPMIGKPKFCPLVEVPTHDKRTETHGVCSDAISRQEALSKGICWNCKHLKRHNGELAEYVCDIKGAVVSDTRIRECDDMWEERQ